MNLVKTRIISGFPGIGKSYIKRLIGDSVLDLDSSSFTKHENGEPNTDFPENYLKEIKHQIGKYSYILVSTHEELRSLLKEYNIPYTIVYPDLSLKEEYIKRYKQRNSSVGFINHVEANWYDYIQSIEGETFPYLIKLHSGEYLSDIFRKGTI